MKKFFRRSLACIIAVVMIATSLPFSAITVGAATENKTIERKCLGVYAEGTGRFKDATSTVTICNDSQNSNFSIGYVTFDISNLSSYGDLDGITASYSFNVALGSDREVLGLSVFYPTKNLKDKFQANGNAGTISDIWKGNDGLHKTRAKSYFGFNLIQRIQTSKGKSENVTVNITPAIIAAKRSGQSTATIAFMNTATGASGDSGGWSDVDLSSFGSSANVTISTAETGNEITGAIKYGPVIYTYSENTQGADYNYLKYGGNISAGDVKSATDCQTPVTLAQGVTVQSVTCLEDSGAILSIENGLLKGNFSCIYDGMVVTLKTKLTYNGNNYIAYNKVYVDTIPVPAHAASISQRYYGLDNPLKSIMAYSQTLKGSTGQNSTDGSSDGGQLKVNAKELYTPLAVTVRYDNKNDTNTWRLNSGIEGVLCDKFAGVTGYSNSGGWGKGTNTLTTVAPTGYYYYDKSTTDNYGFSSQNGNTFSFQLVTLPFKIVTGDNASQGNVNLDTHTLKGNNFTQSDSYTKFSYDYNTGVPSISSFTNTITGDASSITNGVMSGTYELRFANGANNEVWAVNITKTNWNVYVADKSAARTPYNSVNSKVLTSENISNTSWSDYRNAYLNDEAFLASYKNVADSNVQTNSTNYGTSLTSAYNNLEYKVTVNYGDGRVDTAYLKKGNKIGIFGDMLLGKNSATVANNDGTHTKYSWNGLDGTVFDGTVFEYNEPYTLVNCSGGTATCVKKAKCATCGAEYGTVDSNNHVNKTHYDEVPATCTTGGHSAYDVCRDCSAEIGKIDYDALGHNYEYTYNNYSTHTKKCSRGDIEAVEEPHTNDGTGKCTLCRGTIIDKTALNAAIADAKLIYDDNNKDGEYVTESFNEFIAVYNKVTTANPTTQEEVNSLAAELTTATNTLRQTTLTVQFDEKVGNTTTVKENSTASYGEVKEFTATGGDVEQWEIVTDNGTEQPATTTYIKTGENKISLVITRNVKVIAHLAENGTSHQKITKVVFRGRNNAVVAIRYIEANASLATAGVPIPEIPFYHADAWDKTEVFGLENGGVITVRAQYEFNGTETDKCGIHFTDFEGGVKKFNYDTLVKLNNQSKYFGMYSEAVADVTSDEAKNKVLTYFETDEFYAPHNSDIYVYALPEDFTPTATVGVTGSYSRTDATTGRKYAVFNCKFYVPDEATVLEWGIKATAGGQKITFKSDTKSRRNEYSFRINFPQNTSMTSVDAQAYIIYETVKDDKVVKETVLSNNTVTQDF
nr:hypothetical protein [Eubacteriales bacterium]